MLKFHSLRIVEVQPDAEDAVAVALEVPQELRGEYTGLPGQHVVLRAELGGEEARRTYSLINPPGEWPLRIVARVHERGRMSRHLAEEARIGDTIDVLPPNGSLTPRQGVTATSGKWHTYVGFASGCGITPVLSIARSLLQSDPVARFILFYGNSSTARTMCLEELLALKDLCLDRVALHFIMSREPQEVELYNGRIDAARVRELARSLFEVDSVAEFFVCGPGDMIEQVSGALRELKVNAERIHGEHFRVEAAEAPSPALSAAAAPGVRPSAASTPASAPSGASARAPSSAPSATPARLPSDAGAADSCEVTVLMDGRRRTFTMRRGDETVLDAAARSGLDLPFSCRAGVCSTCRTKVVRGEVEMAVNYALEDWEVEQRYILACQARVKTPTLELDYDEK
ncbi:MAG TPA: 2Fe-2S iron-sulfur cluster-binding protein [Steroidobacteraceae bacterium]|nr:2Fe-2S iron-sulfur cluster-binding protein [Steroidobacteraceae bacterium]